MRLDTPREEANVNGMTAALRTQPPQSQHQGVLFIYKKAKDIKAVLNNRMLERPGNANIYCVDNVECNSISRLIFSFKRWPSVNSVVWIIFVLNHI